MTTGGGRTNAPKGKTPIVIAHPPGKSPLLHPTGSGGSSLQPEGLDIDHAPDGTGWDDGRPTGSGTGGGDDGGDDGYGGDHGDHGDRDHDGWDEDDWDHDKWKKDDWHDDHHRWHVSWCSSSWGWGFSLNYGYGWGYGLGYGWGYGWGHRAYYPSCGHRFYHYGCGYCGGHHGHAHAWWWPSYSFWWRPYEPWRAYDWGPRVEVRTVYVESATEPVVIESAAPVITEVRPGTPTLLDAWTSLQGGATERARDEFLTILTAVPYESEARVGYAITSAALGRVEASLSALRQVALEDVLAFEFVPVDADIHGAIRAMIDVYSSRIAVNHDDVDAWFAVAAGRLMLGEPATAYFAASNALQRGDQDPSTRALHGRLGEILYGEFRAE